MMIAHDGLLIASPEYNSSISAALKNAIDWASRPEPNEAPLVAFDGKVAGLMAASPGALGGLRGLVTVRSILGNIKVMVLPDQIAVVKAHEAFNADGTLKDAKQQAAVEKLGATVAGMLKKLKS
jgi:chromate reductase, NAD(P)H dehydrogenase (quinone)